MATQTTKKQAFTMVELLAMWKQKSAEGKSYFTGKTADGKKLVGFYNTNKKNPKEPDIRIYDRAELDTGIKAKPILSLWADVSQKTGKKYLSGKWDGKRVVGFIAEKADEKKPYFRVYLSDDVKKPEPQVEQQEQAAVSNDGDLPF